MAPKIPRINKASYTGKPVKDIDPDDPRIKTIEKPETNPIKNQLALVNNPRCKCCNSIYRNEIDLMLARGFSYRAIEGYLKEIGEELSYKSVERHANSHLNIEYGHYRKLAEIHSKEIQEEIAKGSFKIVSGKAFLDLFIQKGWDALIGGSLEVEARDLIGAIKLREDIVKDGVDQLKEEMAKQLQAIIVAIKEIVPEELQPRIAARAQEIAKSDMMQQLEPPPHEITQYGDIAEFEEFPPELEEGGEVENDIKPPRHGVEESPSDNGNDQPQVFEDDLDGFYS